LPPLNVETSLVKVRKNLVAPTGCLFPGKTLIISILHLEGDENADYDDGSLDKYHEPIQAVKYFGKVFEYHADSLRIYEAKGE